MKPVVSLLLLWTAVSVSATPALRAQDFSEILATASRQTERNAKVTGLRFRCDPEDCRVRPLETLIVQVFVDGEVPVRDGEPRKGRLRRAPGPMKVVDFGGGFVSKPFKYQGTDPGGFVESEGSAFASIFRKVAGDFIVQDSFLYNAPEQPGTYTLENNTEGIKGTVTVTVDPNAPSRKPAEAYTFAPEDHTGEPYRALAEHWAPVLAQETWWQPKSDYAARFDFDNDLIGDNNWENAETGSSQAYVYYAVMETSTHWFVIYNVFHPRDYSDKCVAGSCHENDNEGLILTIERDGSEFGKLLVMETLAHNNVYSFVTDRSIRGGLHNIEGAIELVDGTHPVVFIESGGHGIYGSTTPNHSRYSVAKDEFVSGTGVTYVYKGVAERPRHANDRKVGYDLLPILSHWWPRTSNDSEQRMFDEFLSYAPFGGRPGVKYPKIGNTFLGRKEAANKAKPFWGWHDSKTLKAQVLAPGQWGLDPAYAISRSLRFPASMAVSLDYTYNPYLGVGEEMIASAQPILTTAVAAAGGSGAATGIQIAAGKPTVTAPALGPASKGPLVSASAPEPAASGSILPNLTGDVGTATTNTAPSKGPVVDDGNVFGAQTTPQAPAAPPAAPAPSEGWVEVDAVVDMAVVFHIFGGQVTPEVLGGQPVRDQKSQFSAPLPTGDGIRWSLEKRSGRGQVQLLEQPSATNGYTLKVRVDDSKGGAARHVFRVRWQR